jgi:hypothetical protein
LKKSGVRQNKLLYSGMILSDYESVRELTRFKNSLFLDGGLEKCGFVGLWRKAENFKNRKNWWHRA